MTKPNLNFGCCLAPIKEFNPGDEVYYYDKYGNEIHGVVSDKSPSGKRYSIYIPDRRIRIWVKPENLELANE